MSTILNIFFVVFVILVVASLVTAVIIAMPGRKEKEIKIKCPYDKKECSAFGEYPVSDCTDCHRYAKRDENKDFKEIIIIVAGILICALLYNYLT